MIKILLTFILIAYLFRLIFRQFLSKVALHQQTINQSKMSQTKEIREEIVPCPNCGTYNPKTNALFKNGKYYCNQTCSEQKL